MTQEAPIKPGQVNPPREAVAGAEEPVPSSFRLIFTLGLAGFLSGLLLVLTHQITKPLILANKAAALREAVLEVVPGATSM
ncbi:MAG: hypothetical protein KC729_18525, partial [Candidatus Eisenbacteria bacterium]|nr:hypothetical protein [Candidatus Eisenbacteria bacterium]